MRSACKSPTSCWRLPTRLSNDGVDGPLAASECQTAGSNQQQRGAIHGRGYDNWTGLGEACLSGARGRCRGSDGSAQTASACAGSGVLQPAAALRGWDGGVWDGALLGAGVACAWARGAADAGAIREGLRQAQQERRGGCGGGLRGG